MHFGVLYVFRFRAWCSGFRFWGSCAGAGLMLLLERLMQGRGHGLRILGKLTLWRVSG